MPAQETRLDDLQLFCAVARERSFTRVSEALGIPLATVSRRVANLERQLDSQLLRRSTRRVEPTDAGALLLERAEAPLRGLAEALECLAEESGTPRGRLRVTMPADLARYWLATPLASFASRHPEIRLELDLSSRVVDLAAEGFDRELVRRVIRTVDRNEYKRRQSPPGIRITPKAFGKDRRMPIVNRYTT